MAQFYAQSSDSLGWFPSPTEVQFAVRSALAAQGAAARLVLSCDDEKPMVQPQLEEDEASLHEVALVGAQGSLEIGPVHCGAQEIIADFVSTGQETGLAMPVDLHNVYYSPTGCETILFHVRPDRYHPDTLTLPLANGIVSLSKDTYFIRDNASWCVACRVFKADAYIRFTVTGCPAGRQHYWRFFLFRGSPQDALDFANSVNLSVL